MVIPTSNYISICKDSYYKYIENKNKMNESGYTEIFFRKIESYKRHEIRMKTSVLQSRKVRDQTMFGKQLQEYILSTM